MNPKNNERKQEIFNIVRESLMCGISPTTDMMCGITGLGKATISKYVNRLIDEGALARRGRYGLSLPGMSEIKRIPIVGVVACGRPILAVEDIMGYLAVDGDILGEGEHFGLIAEGDSMYLAGIDDGDVVYIRRQNYASDGDIVVAFITDEKSGEPRATLKRFYMDVAEKRYILHPENPALSDIITNEVEIVGVAGHVMKKLK